MSAINYQFHVRKNQAGVSILELILYVIFAAGLVLAAWFGLNIYLDKGKESAAKQNLVSAYKVARVYKESEPQFNRQFPPKPELILLLRPELGEHVYNVEDYSSLGDMHMGILEASGNRLVAGVRFTSNKVVQMVIELPGAPQFQVLTDGEEGSGEGGDSQLAADWYGGTFYNGEAVFTGLAQGSDLDLECQLDGGSWQPCGLPTAPFDTERKFRATFAELSDGEHAFTVRSGEYVQKTFNFSFSNAWTSSFPVPQQVINWNVTSNGNARTFTGFIQQDIQVECRINEGSWQDCTGESPLPGITAVSATFESVPPGQYRVSVREAGGALKGMFTYPVPTLNTVSNWSVANLENATHIEASIYPVPDSIECRLDSGNWQPCNLNNSQGLIHVNYPLLSPGQHTVDIRATGAEAIQGSLTWIQIG